MVATQPKFNVEFKEEAVLSIQRQKRGDVVLILKETKQAKNVIEYRTLGDVKASEWSADNYDRITLAFLGNPSKVIVIKAQTEFLETQKLLATYSNYTLVYPEAGANEMIGIKNYLNVQRNKNNYSIAIFGAPSVPSDVLYVVDFYASALELRMLAHYMNDGDYTHEILNGDIHTKNQQAAGLPTRDNAKTFIYGFLYGAGDEKIGNITGKGAAEGKKIKTRFLSSLPKLKKLLDGVKNKIQTKGFLLGIDKRKLKVREAYKGLNVLLQSAGAIVMKKALCILYEDCVAKGWIKDKWYLSEDNLVYFVLNIHDEYQAEVNPKVVDEYKVMAVEAIKKAGIALGFRCPLDGEAKEGLNWYMTH